MFKKNTLIDSKTFDLIKLTLITSLLVLTPLTIFLMSFAWYDSIEVHNSHNTNIINQPGFLKHALIFGSIGLVISLIVLFFYLIVDFYLESMVPLWKKIVFFASIITYTLTFINFEVFSAIFINYYFTIQLLLALIFWPLIYSLLISVIVLNIRKIHKNKTEIMIKEFLVNDQLVENNDSETTIF